MVDAEYYISVSLLGCRRNNRPSELSVPQEDRFVCIIPRQPFHHPTHTVSSGSTVGRHLHGYPIRIFCCRDPETCLKRSGTEQYDSQSLVPICLITPTAPEPIRLQTSDGPSDSSERPSGRICTSPGASVNIFGGTSQESRIALAHDFILRKLRPEMIRFMSSRGRQLDYIM